VYFYPKTQMLLIYFHTELIIKQVRREERPELPEEALREAVVNALVHTQPIMVVKAMNTEMRVKSYQNGSSVRFVVVH